jgi:anti-sigma factor RsiW
MPCQELVERVTDYLDGALGERDRVRLEAHLADCEGCVLYVEQLRETVRIAGTVQLDLLDPGARDALTKAFAAWAGSR